MADINVTVVPPNMIAQRLDIAVKVLNGIYAVFMAWQVAKVVCPQLSVHEQALYARLARRFPGKRTITQGQADDFVAEVTRYVRENG